MKGNIRYVSYWLSLLLLLSLVLAACGGGGSTSSQGQTLHVLIGYNSTYPAQQKQWMQQIAGEFLRMLEIVGQRLALRFRIGEQG